MPRDDQESNVTVREIVLLRLAGPIYLVCSGAKKLFVLTKDGLTAVAEPLWDRINAKR